MAYNKPTDHVTGLFNIFLPPGKISLRAGLFFGSFNPVHIGHMAIANYMAEFTGIDQLWFVVSPQNPFKNEEKLLNGYDRTGLVHLAISDDSRFRVCDIELTMPKPSYTIDTLTRLSTMYPDHHFEIIMGSDNLVSLHKWKNYTDIISRYRILIYPRPGYPDKPKNMEGLMEWVNAPMMDISSTFIRDSIKAGKNMKFFLPDKVWETIDRMNYYRK
jgi:nicotinate-nucleotide adenylyltransferase